MRIIATLAAVCLCSCADLPKDADGTFGRIHDSKSFRVGIIAGAQADASDRSEFLQALERSSAARAITTTGSTEPLLKQLEEGKLDLVVGPMTAESPWMKQVHMVKLTRDAAQIDGIQLVAAVRNGENEWISVIHRQAKLLRTR